ncbi:MAG: serine protease [Clostridia bacterium]|nr:serine protease [Clostridia bacterium]
MDYYILSQDARILDFPEPLGISNSLGRNSVKNADALEIGTPVVAKIKERAEIEYIDFIERPVPLVSDHLKEVIEMYQGDTLFKPVVLTDAKRMRQDLYWLTVPTRRECLSSESVFHKDRTLKKLVINKAKIAFFHVFMVEGVLEDLIIIDQDVAESILRRDFFGIALRKVETRWEGAD